MHHLTIPFSKESLWKVGALFSEYDGTTLLYSGSAHDSAQKSLLSFFPYKHLCPSSTSNPWDELQEQLGPLTAEKNSAPPWLGFFSYEAGFYADCDPSAPPYPTTLPPYSFYRNAVTITWEHSSQEAQLLIATEALPSLPPEQQSYVQQLMTLEGWNHLLKQELPTNPSIDTPSSLSSTDTLDSYSEKIQRLLAHIACGDIYQACLSQEFTYSSSIAPYPLFVHLAKHSPAPFSAYMRAGDQAFVSTSPERFLKKTGQTLETRPIKGTMPRGSSPDTDAANKQELLDSTKNHAELLMITDLMRNDLGRVSKPGSVITHELARCETYANVFHLLSVIRSEMHTHIHPLQAIRQAFPPGSISGCPKLRAIELLSEIEHRPRGIYTGAIGYILPNGDFDFNVAIRTLTIENNVTKIPLGGAIIYDSDPILEFEETLHKGKSIFQALNHDLLCEQPLHPAS